MAVYRELADGTLQEVSPAELVERQQKHDAKVEIRRKKQIEQERDAQVALRFGDKDDLPDGMLNALSYITDNVLLALTAIDTSGMTGQEQNQLSEFATRGAMFVDIINSAENAKSGTTTAAEYRNDLDNRHGNRPNRGNGGN